MHAGAIPIVEVCGDETVHYLKAFPEAKELFEATLVRDWGELPATLRRLDAVPDQLDKLQANFTQWFSRWVLCTWAAWGCGGRRGSPLLRCLVIFSVCGRIDVCWPEGVTLLDISAKQNGSTPSCG